jgi:hypothetical protein
MAPPAKSPWGNALVIRLLAGCLAGVGLGAQAQEDTFGGDPSRNAFIPIPSNTDDWLRHFRLGAMVGMNISAKFGLSGNNPFGVNPTPGVYADGYVLPDKSGDSKYTSDWGYTSASQYNAANGTLTFHNTASYTLGNDVQSSDDGFFPGLDMAYGGNLWYWKHARIGWEVGFGLLPINITDRSTYQVSVNQNAYAYNVGSLVLPTAPYSGNGGPNGVGPIISTQNPKETTTTGAQGTLGGSRSLDVMLYTLRLGPTFYWDISQKFSASFGIGPAVGLASGELDYNDVITVGGVSSHNSGSISATDFTYGGYVNGTLLYHLSDSADLYLGAQYMPMGSADFNGGGRSAQLELSGQVYISIGINWPF